MGKNKYEMFFAIAQAERSYVLFIRVFFMVNGINMKEMERLLKARGVEIRESELRKILDVRVRSDEEKREGYKEISKNRRIEIIGLLLDGISIGDVKKNLDECYQEISDAENKFCKK